MQTLSSVSGVSLSTPAVEMRGDALVTKTVRPDQTAPAPTTDRVDLGASTSVTKPQTAPSTPSSPSPSSATGTPPQAKDLKRWTFLFYVNGDNFLAKQAPGQLRMAEIVGSDSNINFVAQVARQKSGLDKMTHDWSGARRYEVPEGEANLDQAALQGEIMRELIPPYTRGIQSDLKAELGQVDMADPKTLSDFVKWGMQNYPAEHYCVIMLGPSQGMNGIMQDDVSGHRMSPTQLNQALADVAKDTGHKVDVLALDASNSTQAEMLYEIKDNVKYVVGSEGLVSGAGMSVPSVAFELRKSNTDKTRTPEEVAQTFTMVGSMAISNQGFTPTVSAIDMTRVGAVKDAVNQLGTALLAAQVDKNHLRQLLAGTQEVGMPGVTRAYEGVRDIYHFAQQVAQDPSITDATVKEAAAAVTQAVDNSLVGEAHRGGAYRNAHGMSFYAPTNYGFERPDHYPVDPNFDHTMNYDKLSFSKDNAWTQLLTSVSKDNFAGQVLSGKVGQHGADVASGVLAGMIPQVKAVGGLASQLGWWESFNVSKDGRPHKVLFIPATPAAYAGAAGGVFDAVQGGVAAARQFNSTHSYDALLYNGIDVLGGVAKTAACWSLLHPGVVPFAKAAGAFGFIKPWVKNAYEYFMQYKTIRDSIALSQGSKAEAATLAVQQMLGKHQIWDK